QPASKADKSGLRRGPVTANAVSVTGGGTAGHLAKWAGSAAGTTTIADSGVFENKFGQVGIGTSSPGSLLTVAGTIESKSGGVKFPDGTVQTTAGIASGSALTSVAHDPSLTGNGTSASPLAVVSDPAALEPFQAEIDFDINDGDAGGSGTFTVPAGKRLVIEYASASVSLPQGQRLDFIQVVTTSASGPTLFAGHFLVPVFVTDDNTNSEFAAAQDLRLYADPSTSVTVKTARNSLSGPGSATITISGHLVDLAQSSPTAARRKP
ncbi:MAG: hypothetical protein ACREDR_13460, partial [Blastocatellia bacterium]